MKIKKNDTVKIIAGKDKGKSGKVIQVLASDDKVVVDGANSMVKHLKSKQTGKSGEKMQFFGPIAVSNVRLICSRCSKPTRVGYKVLEDRSKVRVCHVCHEIIS